MNEETKVVEITETSAASKKKHAFKNPFRNKGTTSVQGNRWSLLFLVPYLLAFLTFIVAPVLVAIGLSFTDYNSITTPNFVGLQNYINLFTNDDVFMEYVIPNTLLFAIITGPVSFFLGFFLAWMLAQIPKWPRTILALLIYSPSLVAGVALQVVWVTIFNGDPNGYLNSILLNMGIIDEAIQWLQDPNYLMAIMIIVTIWSSAGVGFLAMLSGILNVDSQLYEAAYIDGMKNRFQEIFYVTIPSMKPQLLFGAVMAIVNTLQAGSIGVALSGSNPTPNYAGQLIVNHIEDYGFTKYEMGYASAISVVLLIFIYVMSKVVYRIFGAGEEKRESKKHLPEPTPIMIKARHRYDVYECESVSAYCEEHKEAFAILTRKEEHDGEVSE